MQHWSGEEIDFITERLSLNTKELVLDFSTEYGSSRSYDSIQKKIKKLRDAHSEEPDVVDPTIIGGQLEVILQEPLTNTDLLIPNVSNTLKKERADRARAWLEGVVDLSDDMKYRLNYNGSRELVNSEKTSLCVLFSDTHFGKHTKWFNLETARERMLSVPLRIRERTLLEIVEVVVILDSDMVEGYDNHPTQSSDID